MEQPDDLGKLSTVASIAGAVAIGLWRVFARVFRRKGEKVFTSLEIGGTAPELQFAARLTALEEKTAERHEQNQGNFERVFDDLTEVKRMVGAIARKQIEARE